MQMRRMEKASRHQGLWSQCSGGNMVGERGGDWMDDVEAIDCWCDVDSARVEWLVRPTPAAKSYC